MIPATRQRKGPVLPTFADLEIALHRQDTEGYTVEMRYSQPGSDGDMRIAPGDTPAVRFDFARLQSESLDPAAYGSVLGQSLFAAPTLGTAFHDARNNAAALDALLRVRLFISPSAPELHALRWETLRDPEQSDLLLTDERVVFSRYLSSQDWRPVRLRPKRAMRALVVIANPSDSTQYQLAPIDVAGELNRAKRSLTIPTLALVSQGSATLERLTAELRNGPDIL